MHPLPRAINDTAPDLEAPATEGKTRCRGDRARMSLGAA